ncbi:glycoside hydrolase family 2 protein [Listeria cornellensis]|uniref:Beta-galactosidase/beta-glucuronidase n=1 Tax=Listeria cornellensis FSL F6-0969 TaxID=1265820 RepID=W7BNN0_9LIST|nr:glycoside hydrolase family 2 [Listeria cornellensis]EUJ26470.1 beta-galactosidase/beta-glucuronidase [Listeria cornellensis FSL F6-0969]
MLREEYPRPQFVRENWMNLNGEWEFAFDDGDVGLREGWFRGDVTFAKRIVVPFAYQTELSGIDDQAHHEIVWYKREFELDGDLDVGKEVKLHFGAVDYSASIFVNGQKVGEHDGGHTSFTLDITPFVTGGEAVTLVVRVFDPQKDETIPRGKQSWTPEPDAIWYTNTTGIWQTVWLEIVDALHIEKLRMTPNVDTGMVELDLNFADGVVGKRLRYAIHFGETLVAEDAVTLTQNHMQRDVAIYQKQIFRSPNHNDGWNWTPENPNLFQIEFCLEDDSAVYDEVLSYFGMRKVHTEAGMVYLNNRPYYQKLVLDQGYWRDGLLTAPSDEALRYDIELAKEMGFNGCRKHQKVEDPRFLYWADTLGYLVWGECAAAPVYTEDAATRLTREWLEIIERDYNHPSIVTWVPINESWGVPGIHNNREQQHHTQAMYHLIHSLDKTRPVISNDGWEMTETDICAVHNYSHGREDEPQKYADFSRMIHDKEAILKSQSTLRAIYAAGFEHQGAPILLTEFGGIGFQTGDQTGWGYTSVKNAEEFVADYSRVMQAVYSSNALHGYCYTQLTDVEIEINGLLTYDRKPKCELKRIREINDQYFDQIVE